MNVVLWVLVGLGIALFTAGGLWVAAVVASHRGKSIEGGRAMKVFIAIVGFSCVLAFSIAAASAQCVLSSGSTVVSGAESIEGSLIFSGVVVEESRIALGSRVAFDVDGLWRGTLPKKVVFFRPELSEQKYFVVGDRYVVFAYPALPEVRARFQEAGIDPSAVYSLGSDCSTATYGEAERRGYFSVLGPSRPPQ